MIRKSRYREPTDLPSALAEIRRLRTQHKMLESLFQQAPAIYRVIDENGVLLACNNAFERWVEQPRSEILGKDAYTKYSDDQRQVALLTDQKILEERKTIELVESFEWHGRTRHLLTQKAPIVFEGITCITCISIDQTRSIAGQKNLQQEVQRHEQTSQIRDRLLMILGHDVRSPITSLVTVCDAMGGEGIELSTREISSILEEIGGQANNVLTLIDNMLTWVRTQQQTLSAKIEAINVSELTRRSIDLYEKPLTEKSLNLKIDPEGPETVFADRDMLDILLRNFLSNAIKFTPKNGTIRITKEVVEDGRVRVSVIDSGPGISPEKAAQLNMRNSLSKTSGTEKEEGLGLGLSLCKELAERMDGEVLLEPVNPGTRASILLPTVKLDTDLVRLIYRSEAVAPMSEKALRDLAESSAAHNDLHQITGFILYGNGTFIQLLEGHYAMVDALFKRLIKDERHESLLVLLHEPIEHKLFPHWDMELFMQKDLDNFFDIIDSTNYEDEDDRVSLDIINALVRSSGLYQTATDSLNAAKLSPNSSV